MLITSTLLLVIIIVLILSFVLAGLRAFFGLNPAKPDLLAASVCLVVFAWLLYSVGLYQHAH